MFCSKCGKELNDGSKFCPYCGSSLQTDAINQQINGYAKSPPKKPIAKFVLFLIIPFIVIILLIFTFGESGEEWDKEGTIDRLSEFTDVESEEERYTFTCNDTVVGDPLKDWVLTYTPENEFIRVTEDKVVSCFSYRFGYGCLRNPGFSYDLDENEIRIYFDVEIDEGDLSIINYNIDNDEFTIMIDGEKYESSDELIRFMDSYDIPQILIEDIKRIKEELADNGISFDEITALKYQDIVEYIGDRSGSASYEQEKQPSDEETIDLTWVDPAIQNFSTDEATPEPEGQDTLDPGYLTNIEDILRYPNKYMDTVVKVSGTYDDYRRLHEGSQSIVLIGAFPYDPQPLGGDHITVIGIVQKDYFGDMAMSIKDFYIN